MSFFIDRDKTVRGQLVKLTITLALIKLYDLQTYKLSVLEEKHQLAWCSLLVHV